MNSERKVIDTERERERGDREHFVRRIKAVI